MELLRNTSLKNLNTLRVGGNADYFLRIRSLGSLKEAVYYAKSAGLKITVIGGGSNVLIPDAGIRGLTLKMEIGGIYRQGDIIFAGAGVHWDKVVAFAVSTGLSGIENLSLIPGTVGGAVYQNIGAYGAEIKNTIARTRVFDLRTGREKWLSSKACKFGYRTSTFREDGSGRYVITGAELKLKKKFTPNLRYPDLSAYFSSKKPTLKNVRSAIIRIRRRKLPYPPETANAGSFFKNPVVKKATALRLIKKSGRLGFTELGGGSVKLSAAKLIELAGWKGKSLGEAGVSEKHALVIINRGQATATAIRVLAEKIQANIKKKFGILLEPEVRIL